MLLTFFEWCQPGLLILFSSGRGEAASDCLLVPFDSPLSSESFASNFGGIVVSILILACLFCC